MKTILLIGKMNEILEDLNRFLSERFRVQVGTDNAGALTGLIRVTSPELIIISLVGMYEGQEEIFIKIRDEHPAIPVITVGIREERDRFLRFYDSGQFENVARPVDHSTIYCRICERLGIDINGEEAQDIGNGKKRILVVDDNGPTLRTIKTMLEEKYDVQIAPSGMKAMTSMGKRKPDLIVLDYEMPVCDGKQTLEMIRADDELASIPVIFLTSVNDREHIEAVLSLKPAGYLLKPPVKEKLIDTIEKSI